MQLEGRQNHSSELATCVRILGGVGEGQSFFRLEKMEKIG